MLRDQASNKIGKDGPHKHHVENTPNLMTISKHKLMVWLGVRPKLAQFTICGQPDIMVDMAAKGLMDSLANDGSQSWVVISRGVDRYVTELSTACTQSMRPNVHACVSTAHSTGRPVADMTGHAQSKRLISQLLGRRTNFNSSSKVAAYSVSGHSVVAVSADFEEDDCSLTSLGSTSR